MARTGVAFRILTSFVALVLTAFSVGFTWSVYDDYSRRDIVPRGATVEGIDVGGLPREDAVRLIEDKVEKLLTAPLTMEFRGTNYTLDTAKYLSVDVEGMVDETFKSQEQATLATRVYRRVTGESVPVNVTRKLKIDEKGLAGWLDEVAQTTDIAPVDSTLTADAEKLVQISKSAVGYKLDKQASLANIAKALVNGKRDIGLQVATLKPKVDENSFGKSIIVVKSKRHLWLFNGQKLEVDYDVAIGTPGHPTPAGWWTIVNKRKNPSWSNPAPNGWGAGMPAYIPPGYSNPLGTRALDLNAPGIRIHGSSADYSIGTAASHGCMRMHMSQVEDLFERVPVGTRVVIVP